MNQNNQPNSTPTAPADQVLRDFYRRYKTEHAPSQDVFEHIYATIPEPLQNTDTTKGSFQNTDTTKGWLARLQQTWRWGLASTLAGTCGLLLWWGAGQYVSHSPTTPPQHRPLSFIPKGQNVRFSLLHARRTPQGYLYQQTTRMGERLQAGDGVQLSYTSQQPMHLMLVSVNKQGDVSVFVPFEQQQSLWVTAGQGTLPQHSALTLDDYIGLERFFFVYSHQSFSLNDVKRAVQREFMRANRSLSMMKHLPGSWQTQTLLIEKVKSL